MLSYRHAFHAGNHADVLKHYLLVRLLTYLNQKEKPYWYIDTHAGAGCYQLDEGYALKNAEHENGISLLWERSDLPTGLSEYIHQVRAINEDGRLRFYPGSPLLALNLVRSSDRLRLFEKHPTDFPLLEANMDTPERLAQVVFGDGFAGLKALLPPPPRRALILIDPSYEDKEDYRRIIARLESSLQRFATGTYMVWHPLLQREEAKSLPENLRGLPTTKWLHITLAVQRPPENGLGMFGSGVFIINPPWNLRDELQETLPYLAKVLGDEGAGDFQLEERTH